MKKDNKTQQRVCQINSVDKINKIIKKTDYENKIKLSDLTKKNLDKLGIKYAK